MGKTCHGERGIVKFELDRIEDPHENDELLSSIMYMLEERFVERLSVHAKLLGQRIHGNHTLRIINAYTNISY